MAETPATGGGDSIDRRLDASDQRQDASDQRQNAAETNAAEVQQKASDVFSVILGTLTRLDAGQSRIETKLDRQTERMDTLVDTTNHRLDDFREDADRRAQEMVTAFAGHQVAVAKAMEAKAEKSSLGPQLFLVAVKTNRWLQITLAASFIALAPVVADHWHLLSERFLGGF